MPNTLNLTGIAEDPGTREVWFAEHLDRRVSRLREATGDGDGIIDSDDNCPNHYNPGQENTDGFVDQTPPRTVDDYTWINSDPLGDACDDDDDNDGVSDAAEDGAWCPFASGPTHPRAIDSDGDRIIDIVECDLGYDPSDRTSKPPWPSFMEDTDRDGLSNAFESSIGSNAAGPDTDGDGLRDGVEFRAFGSSVTNRDTDDDGVSDGCEVASINADTIVNPGDQALLASEIVRPVPVTEKLANMDLNKDGAFNPGDQAFQASKVGRCPNG
jgi:hypothetical protein